MNEPQELVRQGHKDIDDHANLEIDLIDLKCQQLLSKNEYESNKLIVQNESIIRRHYGTE